MHTLCGDRAIVEENDLVCILDRMELVCDHNDSLAIRDLFHRAPHFFLVFRIDKGGGFIEYDDGSIFEYRSCKGDSLLLSARQHIACKSGRRIVTIRE